MATLSDQATYVVHITLATEVEGTSVPSKDEVSRIVAEHLSHDYLDEETGLFLAAVSVHSVDWSG